MRNLRRKRHAAPHAGRGDLSIRLSKAALVCAMALLASLAALNNLTDYATNFAFVRHVFLMDTTLPGNGLRYRSIDQSWMHHAGYLALIALQSLTAVLCWIGSVRLFRTGHEAEAAFRSARAWAVTGLTLGFLTWQVSFMTIGGEWFGMWMSSQWNGLASAFRFFMTFGLVLIYLIMPSDDTAAAARRRPPRPGPAAGRSVAILGPRIKRRFHVHVVKISDDPAAVTINLRDVKGTEG